VEHLVLAELKEGEHCGYCGSHEEDLDKTVLELVTYAAPYALRLLLGESVASVLGAEGGELLCRRDSSFGD
jgi:hypothetical protein